jgi:predicted cation transporter
MTIVAAPLAILLVVLLLPFWVKKIEDSLELFLFAMGAIAVTLGARWSWPLAREALVEPIKITAAVLVAGLLFKLLRPRVRKVMGAASSALGARLIAFLVVVVLGFLSSAVTAIVAALLLVEAIDCMRLDRAAETKIVVLSCFAIGMGAALTPLGEPLATIVVAKLRGEPYEASFWFLFSMLGRFVIPGILGFGLLAAVLVGKGRKDDGLREEREEGYLGILLRAAKTYLFVVALVLLGAGFKPIVDAFVSKLPASGLFWLNSISAILDNATLAAAEIGPSMGMDQIVYALLGLLIAGGMLVPGNIPNIIAAGRLKITSKEWMRIAAPVGAIAMALYFALLMAIGL